MIVPHILILITEKVIRNITDGDEPFYQKLDADSVPFTGSGTEDDPYVYCAAVQKRKFT